MIKFRSDNLPIRDVFRESGFSGKAALVLSTWFGCGLFPIAPGTFGTLAAVPLVLVLNKLGLWYSAVTLVIAVGISIWSAGLTQDLLGKDDPSAVVIDEVAGFLLAMTFLPFSWLVLGLGFVLFRIFDVFKPYPIRQLEGLSGGFGIVIDDLLAGLYTCACVRVALFLFGF
jgi:phosphatidylglycerophosphatase A